MREREGSKKREGDEESKQWGGKEGEGNGKGNQGEGKRDGQKELGASFCLTVLDGSISIDLLSCSCCVMS